MLSAMVQAGLESQIKGVTVFLNSGPTYSLTSYHSVSNFLCWSSSLSLRCDFRWREV